MFFFLLGLQNSFTQWLYNVCRIRADHAAITYGGSQISKIEFGASGRREEGACDIDCTTVTCVARCVFIFLD